jgi:hypothetical protein
MSIADGSDESRSPANCFENNLVIRHRIDNDIWYASYDKSQDTFVRITHDEIRSPQKLYNSSMSFQDDEFFQTLGMVAKTHHRSFLGDPCKTINAWKVCEYLHNNEWKPTASFSYIDLR